tara:strand:+ start:927 stop:1919 length:993 start_codon:yes stop_codon:yes gene_type:complete
MMPVEFELCKKDKVEELINFIDKHWKQEHIFVRNRELFNWQHKNKDSYNFVLAIEDNKIIGILGFIPTSQFSDELIANNEMWLAIWKVKDDIKKPGLGILMLNFLKKKFNNPTICSVGLSKQVIPIYKALKYEVGVLEHRAFFNQNKRNFGAISPPKDFLFELKKSNVQFEIQEDGTNLEKCKNLFKSRPKKNPEYITKRYLEHPVYEYKLLFFRIVDEVISILVYRIVLIENLIIARIVDLVGSNILEERFNYPIAEFLKKENIDYIDIVSNLSCFRDSGFIKNNENFILPNYFEPLELRNIGIDFAYKSNSGFLSIFKGDSDQDRPNI